VHHRFYSAYDNTTLLYEILKSIKWARKIYGNLPVNVVGHYIGGDLASFCALGLFDVEHMTFGQPRIGNPTFAVCLGEQVPRTIHVTHQNDIVSQLPPYYYYLSEWTYQHFARELYGNVVAINEIVCDDSGEDPTYSRYIS
ncbi:hypothetical protein ACJX0J_009121, partial [Zea mays]